MPDLTQDEINDIVNNSSGKLTDWQCRLILAWMMGYMRFTGDVDHARQAFFKQIKGALPQ